MSAQQTLLHAPSPRSGGSAGRRNVLVATSSGLVSGLLNAAILALSARDGQTGEIAAYTVVTAALAFVAIAVGGGSSLLYISGDHEQRRAVRSLWVFVVFPSLVVGTVLTAALYTRWGYEWPACLAAGVVAIGNNLAQLQLGDLARQLRFTVSAVVICGCKLPVLVLVAGGAPLTTALLVATVAQFIAVEATMSGTSWLRRAGLGQLSMREAFSAIRTKRKLFTYTFAELYSGRAACMALSVLAGPRIMGCFGTIVNAYQALGAVLYAGLQVPMVARVRDRHGLAERGSRNRDAEVLAVLGATAAAVVVFIAAPWITDTVLRLPIPEAADWLRILAAALPFVTVNRAVALNLIGDGDYRSATRVALLTAAIITPIIAVTVPLFGPLGAAWSALCGELLTVAVLVAFTAQRGTFVLTRKGV